MYQSTWRGFDSLRQRFSDVFHIVLNFMTQPVERRMHPHKLIKFSKIDIIKNIYSNIRTGLRGMESRLEDKWDVKRIRDSACVVT